MKITFYKELKLVGGPSSFQKKFIHWLKINKIGYDFLNINNFFKKKILIINSGTFNFPLLVLSILFKTKLVQRLDGFYDFSNIGRKTKSLKCLCINISMQIIRKYFADHVVYQSLTSKKLWDKTFKKVKTNYSIIHNPSFDAVLTSKKNLKSVKLFDIVIVEGNIENNLFNEKILYLIFKASIKNINIRKIYIFGNINNSLKKKLSKNKIYIFKNTVSHKELKTFYKRTNIIFFGIEYNPCCSNSIIEANSYGIPSITLNTGSYKELIKNSGIQINFNSIDSKNLLTKFSSALLKITKNYSHYSKLSYKNSQKFDPNYIFKKYIRCIEKLL